MVERRDTWTTFPNAILANLEIVDIQTHNDWVRAGVEKT